MYYILKFPYASKKKIGIGSNSKYCFSGNAYYFVNKEDGSVFHQFATIDDGFEYRLNSFELTEKKYWKRKNHREPRNIFFDWSNKDKQTQKIKSGKINAINKYIIENFNTVLTTESFITGSNSSGSKKNIKNSPILIFSKDINYTFNLYRFTNFFNDVFEKNKSLLKLAFEDNFSKSLNNKEITLEEYFEKYKNNKRKFIIDYNYFMTDEFSEEIENSNFKLEAFDKEAVDILINRHDNNIISLDELKRKLRLIYSSQVNGFISKSVHRECYFKDVNFNSTEKAHIVSFNRLFKLKRYYDAVDPKNCILIDPTSHTLFDKNIITYNLKGEVIIIKPNLIKDEKLYNLDINLLKSIGAYKFLEENYKHYLDTGANCI
ncbi:MAG4270 family putative restriction endonuclease [Spiroplasma endosymbiont of Cantharis lateralis]|uniref:MAG4270 family putative restriction endonuclease n=1 Tax=Spiroplasma endosymbiont of Cantharis lateralis TaxID=3066277 RepID=UPI00313C1214